MVRAIYCEMLGHDVAFAHVKALQFASEPNILTKKVRCWEGAGGKDGSLAHVKALQSASEAILTKKVRCCEGRGGRREGGGGRLGRSGSGFRT